MKILKAIGIFFSIIITYLGIVIFSPLLKTKIQKMDKGKKPKEPANRETFHVSVEGTVIEGWFYKNKSKGISPCVILSTGFAGTKDGLLEQYALKFNEAGFHAITYDFRFFGASAGKPRQLYSMNHQVKDLKTIIKYAKVHPLVDEESIVLWGTSAGAQLGIIAAGADSTIACVIGQCGAYDREKDGKYLADKLGYGHFMKLFVHAQRDKGRSRFNLSPHRITAYGKPGTLAMFNAEGIFDHVQGLLGEADNFKNEVTARSLFLKSNFDPIESSKAIECSVLLQSCDHDELVSQESDQKLIEILEDKAKKIKYPIGHFEIYEEEHFEKAIHDQIEFIHSALNP